MTTLATLYRALGHALDDLEVYTLASATNSSGTVAALVDGTAGAAVTALDGAFAYNPTGQGTTEGQQTRIRDGSFAPGTGSFTIDPAWAAPNGGTDLLLTRLAPIIAGAGAQTDYRTITNRALQRMLDARRISVTITPSQSLSLTPWSFWLDRPERLVRVREPGPTGGIAVDASWRRPKLVVNGSTPTLELDVPFPASAAGQLLTLDVLAPVSTWILPTLVGAPFNGTWGESTTGLVLDLSEADVSVNDFLPFGLYEMYADLAMRSPGIPNGNWSRKATEQLAICLQSAFWDTTSQRPAPPQQQPQQPGQAA